MSRTTLVTPLPSMWARFDSPSAWGRYVNSGHLTYVSKGVLYAVPFDLNRLEVRGTATPVLDGIAYSAAWGFAQIDFSRNGTVVYRSSRGAEGLVTVQWLDESGAASPLLAVPGSYLSPALSPDGNRLALTLSGDIWVYDLKRASMVRLTFGGGYGNPLWTPDGKYIVFRAATGIMWIDAGGTGRPELLMQGKDRQLAWSFTPDGKRLAFVDLNPVTGADIWTVPVEEHGSGLRAGNPEVFLQTAWHERGPMFSPDGRWLAYMSNESGRYRVYVESFPVKGMKRQASGDDCGYPAWSRTGAELFFWHFGAKELMATSYKVRGDSVFFGEPHVWLGNIAAFSTTRSYYPAPDGKRIVALTPAENANEAHGGVVFLLNFFDELNRRIPAN